MQSEKVYFINFVVEGRGIFPLDMLRYDHCWFASQDDVSRAALSTVSGLLAPEQNLLPLRQIKLNGWSFTKPSVHWRPEVNGITAARWNSFGWRVVEVNGVKR